jgi:hypothetical protein
MIFKKIKVPNKFCEIDLIAIEMWEVRWDSRHGKYFDDNKEEVETFTCKEDAQIFKEALEAAFKLLRYSYSITDVIMKKRGCNNE